MFLFDTDVLSNILRKNPSSDLLLRLSQLTPEEQFTTTITVGELVYGAYKSNRPEYFLEKLDRFVWPNVNILPFDDESAYKYGKLRAEMEKKGRVVMEPDLRIASIALASGLTLVTGNIKHFLKIPGLKVENWIRKE
ncbi:MAG: type II toxin-antitoxin system VapC family toxin [Nitrospirae bacterium]|nr:type II toxin-antitoxin system VapC family toxin [Nitrospirota bacterium]